MLIGHFNKGQLLSAGAVGAAPAHVPSDPKGRANLGEGLAEEDELEVVAQAVASHTFLQDTSTSIRVMKNHKVVMKIGQLTEEIDDKCHRDQRDPIYREPEERKVTATPAASLGNDCSLGRLVGKMRTMRVPLRLKEFYNDEGQGTPDRVIVEFCCGSNSRIGHRTRHSEGCRVIRVTEELDATSSDGFLLAAKGCTMKKALLYSSIPCTGGSGWTHINKHIPSAFTKIRKHRKLFEKLFQTFIKLCEVARECGTFIAIEWPTGCTYWKNSRVRELIQRYGLRPVKFHGCALNVRATSGPDKGKRLKKPWTIFTDCPYVVDIFSNKLCQRDHDHAECRGKVCKESEDYSADYVACLHRAFKRAVDDDDLRAGGSN